MQEHGTIPGISIVPEFSAIPVAPPDPLLLEAPEAPEPRKEHNVSYLFEPHETSQIPSSASLVAVIRYDPSLPYPPWTPQANLFIRRWMNAVWSDRLAAMYLVRYQLERMESDAKELGWERALAKLQGDENRKAILDKILLAVEKHDPDGKEPVQILLSATRKGVIRAKASRLPLPLRTNAQLLPITLFTLETLPPSAQLWKAVILATVVVEPSPKMRYHTDTFSARHALLMRSGLLENVRADVLYLGLDGCVAGGARTTPYFWQEDEFQEDSGRWVTPRLESGCYQGVTRRYSLENGLCFEGDVPLRSLNDGDKVWLSNSMLGWGWGPLMIVEH